MLELGRYRSPGKPHDIEVRCPVCSEPFFIAEPDAEVSVAACPRADCQAVCFVCTRGTKEFKYYEAVALEALVRGPKRDPWPIPLLWISGMFVALPIWMLYAAWHAKLRTMIVLFVGPALFFGVLMWTGLIASVIADIRCARRLFKCRRHAIGRARWLETRDRRG